MTDPMTSILCRLARLRAALDPTDDAMVLGWSNGKAVCLSDAGAKECEPLDATAFAIGTDEDTLPTVLNPSRQRATLMPRQEAVHATIASLERGIAILRSYGHRGADAPRVRLYPVT